MTRHVLVEVLPIGWRSTGYSTPPAFRVDGRCSCGYIASTSAPAGEEAALLGLVGMHNRHVRLAELEDRIVARYVGVNLTTASTFRLTEGAARRFAALAIEEFLRPRQ